MPRNQVDITLLLNLLPEYLETLKINESLMNCFQTKLVAIIVLLWSFCMRFFA